MKAIFLALILLISPVWAEPSETESAAINHLLDRVRESHLTFIRNGKDHDGPAAAEHIQQKYRPSEITTAEEFITKFASRSEMSGDPYKVRLESGTEIKLADWLKDELVSWKTHHDASP